MTSLCNCKHCTQQEIVEIKSFTFEKPKEALLELLQRCNLKCKHCYVGNKTDEGELGYEQWCNILDKLKKKGVKNVVLLGGEPTMHPAFYDILQHAIDNFEYVNVETNGTTETKLSEYDCSVSISFEDSDPETNNEIRGNMVFETALKKLKVLPNEKWIRGTIYNNNDVLGMAMLAERCGANSVFVPFLATGWGTGIKELVPSKRRLMEVYEEVYAFNEQSKFHHTVNNPQYYLLHDKLYSKFKKKFLNRGRVCGAGCNRIFINFKGETFPCPFMQQVKTGNILNDDVNFIYNNLYKFNKEVKEMPVKGKCAGCKHFNVCGGGCAALFYDEKVRMGRWCPVGVNTK